MKYIIKINPSFFKVLICMLIVFKGLLFNRLSLAEDNLRETESEREGERKREKERE